MRRIDILGIDGKLFTRKLLLERYSISYETLSNWVKRLGINPPKRGQPFGTDDVIALDELWIAVRIENMFLKDYENLIENGISLSLYIKNRYWGKNLADYLYNQIALNASYIEHPVVQETLRRVLYTSPATSTEENQKGESHDEP